MRNFYVVATNGEKFGPVPEASLRVWYAEGRVVSDSLLEDAQTRERSPARLVLTDLFPGAQTRRDSFPAAQGPYNTTGHAPPAPRQPAPPSTAATPWTTQIPLDIPVPSPLPVAAPPRSQEVSGDRFSPGAYVFGWLWLYNMRQPGFATTLLVGWMIGVFLCIMDSTIPGINSYTWPAWIVTVAVYGGNAWAATDAIKDAVNTRSWRDTKDFQACQQIWNIWGMILLPLGILFLTLFSITLFVSLGQSGVDGVRSLSKLRGSEKVVWAFLIVLFYPAVSSFKAYKNTGQKTNLVFTILYSVALAGSIALSI